MSLEHLVPEEGKYSEEKHNSPRRWECRGGGVDRGANRGTPEGQRQSHVDPPGFLLCRLFMSGWPRGYFLILCFGS